MNYFINKDHISVSTSNCIDNHLSVKNITLFSETALEFDDEIISIEAHCGFSHTWIDEQCLGMGLAETITCRVPETTAQQHKILPRLQGYQNIGNVACIVINYFL